MSSCQTSVALRQCSIRITPPTEELRAVRGALLCKALLYSLYKPQRQNALICISYLNFFNFFLEIPFISTGYSASSRLKIPRYTDCIRRPRSSIIVIWCKAVNRYFQEVMVSCLWSRMMSRELYSCLLPLSCNLRISPGFLTVSRQCTQPLFSFFALFATPHSSSFFCQAS